MRLAKMANSVNVKTGHDKISSNGRIEEHQNFQLGKLIRIVT